MPRSRDLFWRCTIATAALVLVSLAGLTANDGRRDYGARPVPAQLLVTHQRPSFHLARQP